MTSITRHDDGSVSWKCSDCNHIVVRHHWQSDVDCGHCGACYNAGGQRLRDDWRLNPSVYDEDIDDMTGFEISQLRKEIYG